MEAFTNFINWFDGLVWGVPMIILLFGTHLFLTARTGVIQRKIGTAIKLSVTKDHGRFFDKNGTLFMATLHPAALLRNPRNKPLAFEDFVALREKIHEVCDHTY